MTSLSRSASRHGKNRGRLMRCSWSRDSKTLNTNIRTKLILTKLLRRKLIVQEDTLKPRINRDVSQLVQTRTTKTLLRQLLVTYLLGTRGVSYLETHYIILFRNLTRIRELLLIVYGNLFLITPILYPILTILTLLLYQALLASLLRIIGNIDSYSIVADITQLF